MSDTNASEPKPPTEEPRSMFWTIVLYVGAIIIIPLVLFIDLAYVMQVVYAFITLNVLLVVLFYIGLRRHEQVKDKDVSATTFSRKMFNIISGLMFAFFIWLFLPWPGFFVLLAIDYAFCIHEIIYAILKKKTYFTDAFIALGRQSDPYKPYWASIMALLGFTIVLTAQILLFQTFLPLIYVNVVIVVYIGTILIWGIGDTAAYFAGTKYGSHKLPWNKKKSWEGLLANMAVGIGLGLLFFAPFMLPFIATGWWIALAIIGGVTGAFFESFNLHLDDNFVTVTAVGLILGVIIILI